MSSPLYNGSRFQDKVRQFEIGIIKIALIQTGGNLSQAAKLLEIKLTTLNQKIERYEIPGGKTITAATEE